MTEYVIGPGVAQAMNEYGDEPRSNEMYITSEAGHSISQTYGRDVTVFGV